MELIVSVFPKPRRKWKEESESAVSGETRAKRQLPSSDSETNFRLQQTSNLMNRFVLRSKFDVSARGVSVQKRCQSSFGIAGFGYSIRIVDNFLATFPQSKMAENLSKVLVSHFEHPWMRACVCHGYSSEPYESILSVAWGLIVCRTLGCCFIATRWD